MTVPAGNRNGNAVASHIQSWSEDERDRLFERIDRIDARLRCPFDIRQISSDHIFAMLEKISRVSSNSDVQVVQLALEKIGFNCGVINGVFASKTVHIAPLRELLHQVQGLPDEQREKKLDAFFRNQASSTQRAVYAYQKAKGFKRATGFITEETLAALKADFARQPLMFATKAPAPAARIPGRRSPGIQALRRALRRLRRLWLSQ